MNMTPELQEIMFYFGITVAIVFPLGIYMFLLIDKLIKRMFESFNEEWISSNKPCGMFYAPQKRTIESMIAMQLNLLRWIFKTPLWIKDDTLSLGYLRKIRWILIVINVVILLLFISLISVVLK